MKEKKGKTLDQQLRKELKLPLPKKVKPSINSRLKGHQYERDTANFYKEVYPNLATQIRRGQQSREGDDAPDVIVPGKGWWIECGRRNHGCWMYDKWKQAKLAKKPEDRPVLHLKVDRGDDLVMISRAHWDILLRRLMSPV